MAWLAAIPVAAVLLFLVFQAGRLGLRASRDSGVDQQVAEWSALKGEINADRREWQRERQQFQQQSALLLQQFADINSQRLALDEQRQKFETRQGELEQALSKLDAQGRQLEERTAASRQGPALETEVAEINRQKRLLEQQRKQYQTQTGLVAQELDALNTQRLDLERQQQALEEQRRDLQALMERYEQASRSADPVSRAPGVEPQMNGTVTDFTDDTQLMANNPVVKDSVLGEMRGGLRVGDNLDVSFGITRSGSINGIEQFSNSVFIADLSQLASTGGGLPPAGIMLIQNGLGNSVDVGALQAMSDSWGTVIQNTLDNQVISTMTVIDVSLQNVSSITSSIAASHAVSESLSLQP